MISKELEQCTADMRVIADTGHFGLDAQVRAYDLLEKIMDLPDGGAVGPADVYSDTVATWCSALGPAEEFCTEYARLADVLGSLYDEAVLRTEADARLKPLAGAIETAALKSKEAAALHECAKKTFELWQNGSFFARQSALKNLRKRAGFRLESDRIGNYVAKTFDLMNEAQTAFARAQQDFFAANVTYKIKPGLYSRIAEAIRPVSVSDRKSR